MTRGGRRDAIVETSSLVHFIKIDRVDLLTSHPAFKFFITEIIDTEVSRRFPGQRSLLDLALREKFVTRLHTGSGHELDVFARLTATLGRGEAEGIAAAKHHGIAVVLDDTRARQLAVAELGDADRVLTTSDVMTELACSRHPVQTVTGPGLCQNPGGAP